MSALRFFNLVVVSSLIYAVLCHYVPESARLYQQSEDPVRNILPEEVVERLMRSHEMIADRLELASILLADGTRWII